VVLIDELGYLEDMFIYDSTSAIPVLFMMLDECLLVENLVQIRDLIAGSES